VDRGDKKRQAHLAVLGPDMKLKSNGFPGRDREDANLIEVRVVALANKRAFVAWLEASGRLAGAILKCKY